MFHKTLHLQECESDLTSQYSSLFGLGDFLSFCLFVFLFLYFLVFFVFMPFCLVLFFVFLSFCLADQMSEKSQVTKSHPLCQNSKVAVSESLIKGRYRAEQLNYCTG